MRDGAVGEAHVVAPARALRHVDARRPVLARQNARLQRASAARSTSSTLDALLASG